MIHWRIYAALGGDELIPNDINGCFMQEHVPIHSVVITPHCNYK